MRKIACVTTAGAVAIVLLWSALTVDAQTDNPAPRVVTIETAQTAATLTAPTRKKVFETVWNRVNDRYYDPTFGGVNWKAVRSRYAPRALAPQSDADFYRLMQQMLNELKRSHFAIIPPAAYVSEAPENAAKEAPATAEPASAERPPVAADARDGAAGMVIQLVENKLTISQVEKSGPAQAAGLRPGYVVTRLQNRPLDPLVEQIRQSAPTPSDVPFLVRQTLSGALHGPNGSELVIGYRDEKDQDKSVTIKRGPLPGTPSRFGELPTIYVQTESQTLPGNIGYVRFNIYLLPVLEPVRTAIAQMRKNGAKGVIMDLRGNPGGMGVLAPSIASSFYNKRTDLGAMAMRQGVLRFPVYPGSAPYRGPLVILTDSGSASTSEIFAGSLQEDKRAVVIGERTAGKVMPSVIESLPGTGARLQYAFADFKTPKGKLLEGRGVLPDVPVTLTRRALLADGDPVLAVAIRYINGLPQNQVPAAQKNQKVQKVN